jgi:hypothetical protein
MVDAIYKQSTPLLIEQLLVGDTVNNVPGYLLLDLGKLQTPLDNRGLIMVADVVALFNDGTSASFQIHAGYTNDLGVMGLDQSVSITPTDTTGGGGPAATGVLLGDYPAVEITGVAATTGQWRGYFRLFSA